MPRKEKAGEGGIWKNTGSGKPWIFGNWESHIHAMKKLKRPLAPSLVNFKAPHKEKVKANAVLNSFTKQLKNRSQQRQSVKSKRLFSFPFFWFKETPWWQQEQL